MLVNRDSFLTCFVQFVYYAILWLYIWESWLCSLDYWMQHSKYFHKSEFSFASILRSSWLDIIIYALIVWPIFAHSSRGCHITFWQEHLYKSCLDFKNSVPNENVCSTDWMCRTRNACEFEFLQINEYHIEYLAINIMFWAKPISTCNLYNCNCCWELNTREFLHQQQFFKVTLIQ